MTPADWPETAASLETEADLHAKLKMMKRLPVFFSLLLVACAQPVSPMATATHDLVAHTVVSDIHASGPQHYASCQAYYTASSDSTNTPISFEADSVVTCNGTAMSRSGSDYTTTVPYIVGADVVITIVRPDDGSSFIANVPVD